MVYGYFAYGIYSVDGTIYQFLSNTSDNSGWATGPFQGVNLIYTRDNGATFYRWDGVDVTKKILSTDSSTQFFYHQQPRTFLGKEAYAFSTISFALMGKDNSQAMDNYIYMYAPDGPYPHQLNMARVSKDKILDRKSYEYFVSRNSNGSANWTTNMANRGIVHTFPEKTGDEYFGWYSWQPSVVWNKALGLFVMVNGGTYGGNTMTQSEDDFYNRFMHKKPGSLGIYTSEKPWGPWTEIYYSPYWYPQKKTTIKGQYINASFDEYKIDEWGVQDINLLEKLKSVTGDDAIEIVNVERVVIKTGDMSIDNLSFYGSDGVQGDIMDGETNWITSFDYLWDGDIDQNDIESIYDIESSNKVIRLYARGVTKAFTFRPLFDTADIHGVKFELKTASTLESIEIKINATDGNWYRFMLTRSNRSIRMYQPKLSPKWISEDGSVMTLIWSDNNDYRWHEMQFVIKK
jgi:hypothetical protein